MIVKDTWTVQLHPKEGTFSKDLEINNSHLDPHIQESIEKARKVVNPTNPQYREKQHISIPRASVHISHFDSLFELVGAFLDIVKGMQFLQQHKVAPRCIDYTNLFLQNDEAGTPKSMLEEVMEVDDEDGRGNGTGDHENDNGEGDKIGNDDEDRDVQGKLAVLSEKRHRRRGVLIDYDHTSVALSVLSANNRINTGPFTAIEMLLYDPPHTLAHDLEYLFYVLLFICSHLQGPGSGFLRDWCVKKVQRAVFMTSWFKESNMVALALLKQTYLFTFFGSVLHDVGDYFRPLEEHIIALRNTLFPRARYKPCRLAEERDATRSPATCQQFIDIFEKALAVEETSNR